MPQRRKVLMMAGLCALKPLPGQARAGAAQALHVGTHAPQGEGLYSWRLQGLDRALPQLQPLAPTPHGASASWLCAEPASGLLYSADEDRHSLSLYRQDASGRLQRLQQVPSGGQGPVHLSLHPHAPYALVAHYGSAELALFRRAADGRLSPLQRLPSCAAPDDCRPGPPLALRAPPGSRAISGHEAPHLHMAAADASGRFVLASDLGRDRLLIWPFDAAQGRLGPKQELALSEGAGPRHFVFHPQRPEHCYVLSEEASTLSWVQLDAAQGRLSLREEISSLPAGFAGTSFASDLLCSADGRFLYALNRLHDSVAVFALSDQGQPRLIHHEWTRGSYPRSAALSPCGRWLLVCNQRSDHLSVFALQPADGLPRFSGLYLAVPSPACAVFMPL